jgi:hypothetical protein
MQIGEHFKTGGELIGSDLDIVAFGLQAIGLFGNK